LPFEAINIFEDVGQRLSGFSFSFKESFLMMLELGNISKINRVVVALVTILTPQVRRPRILR
jgi:hypothetical protein